MVDDETPVDDYEVGYARPPLETRFKHGHSGNPRGRPKKSKDLNRLIQAELDKTIAVKADGRDKRITKREAIITQMINRAIKGDLKPLQLVLSHLEKHREIEPFVSTEADDADLLRAMALADGLEQEDNNGDD